jgi:hypothetical protein
LTQPCTARAESADTYVFEATAALNGVDTINNFNMSGLATDDVLQVSAFLNSAPTAVVVGDIGVAGSVDTAGNAVILYNKASLAATDITVTALQAGKLTIGDNGKAVVLVTADANGAADATNDGYKMYYVEDTDAGAGQTYAVTLVGNINSASELNAAAFSMSNFA